MNCSTEFGDSMCTSKQWINRNGPATNDVLVEKAKEIVEVLSGKSEDLRQKYANFKYSDGWLHKFKERNGRSR